MQRVTLTRHYWKHEHRATGSGNVSFPAVKGISSRKALNNLGRSVRHRGRSKESKVIRIGKQWTWIKLDLPERELTWAELWRKDQFRISFLLRSVYDKLPSSVNLHQWGLVVDPNCKLYGKRETMVHILPGCQVALTKGRYIQMSTWKSPARASWCAGGGEEKETTNRPEARTNSVCETGWSYSWQKNTKAESSAR